jgi:hypothetical protein
MWFDRRGARPTEPGKPSSNEPHEQRCLEAMGGRLHREALRLAARYPAAAPRMTVASHEPRFWAKCSRSTWLTVAAALIIAALLWQMDGEQDQTAGDRSLAVSSPADTAPLAVETPGFLLEISDPELEALLDLWESDGAKPTRLSI